MVRLALWLVFVATFTGCMKKNTDYPSSMVEEAWADDDAFGRVARAAPAPPPPPPPPGVPTPAPAPSEPAATPAPRMVHYSGWARLRHPRADEIVAEVEQLATEAGGFVEASGGGRVTVRVPVERFDGVFGAVLALAPVLSRSVTAKDVTDAFTAVELRLRTARDTLARLQELLARAEDEQDKLELLRQIQRLTESIDAMERQSRLLAGLAAMSRITVEIDGSSAADDAVVALAGMEWIGALTPFGAGPLHGQRALVLPAPDGFVQVDPKGTLDAESADGATIRGARLRNDPDGSTAFWADAVIERLGDEFADVARETRGGFEVVTLVEPAERDWRWSIAVRADGRWLHVVVVYYPSAAHAERYRDTVLGALAGGAA